jgi:hypothetical protein
MIKTLSGIQAYPLAWPMGWQRTRSPRRSPYKLPLEKALQSLTGELRLFRAKDFVVSCNVRPRLAGLPHDAVAPKDPAVAVYWEDQQGRPRVMACDAWDSVRANVRAVTLTINALRQIERSGATQLLERAFTGFAALPADATGSWRQVFEWPPEEPVTSATVATRYRQLARVRHPDGGGTHEALIQLNRARDEAMREVKAQP